MPAGHHAQLPPSGQRGQPRGHASFEEIDGITLQGTVIGTPTGFGVSSHAPDAQAWAGVTSTKHHAPLGGGGFRSAVAAVRSI
jgi:hypothetical protein